MVSNDTPTWILAVVGGLALLASSYLALITKRATDAANKTARAAQAEAAAAAKQLEVSQQQIEVSQRQADIAQHGVEVQMLPVLVEQPLDLSFEERAGFEDIDLTVHPGGILVSQQDDRARVSMPVLNVGRGPARIGTASLRHVSEEGHRMSGASMTSVTRATVPVDGAARVNFVFDRSTQPPAMWDAWSFVPRYGSFSVLVRYTDLAGGQDTISRYDVHTRDRAQYEWEVRSVYVETAKAFEAEEQEYAQQHPD